MSQKLCLKLCSLKDGDDEDDGDDDDDDDDNAFSKVQSCKLYNNKYMITSTQITETYIFTFRAVLVFKLLTRRVLFINRKDNRNCNKVGYFL